VESSTARRSDCKVVMTGEGAEAVYVIGPDAFLQREKTKITFEDSAGAQAMRIVTGSVLSVFGKGREKARKLQLTTPTATIGIRGTGCYIEAEEARTYFCLCYGEAEAVPTGDPKQKETIRTTHHEHPIYILATGGKMMAPATVMDEVPMRAQRTSPDRPSASVAAGLGSPYFHTIQQRTRLTTTVAATIPLSVRPG